jgi:DUF4097 and DUF4098 domain-containing protein YvlB
MRALTAPDRPPAVDRPSARGRWIWTVSGLVTVAALSVPVAFLITRGANNGNGQFVSAIPSRMVTVAATVTSLSVISYGSAIQVTTGPVRHVTVRESINYTPASGPAPAVTDQVSAGRLTLVAPACATSNCSVGFAVTVPSSVAVTADSDGGAITVAGAAGANLDSGGGPVRATGIDGPLTISSENGTVAVSDVSAPTGTNLDSGGGPIQASHIDGPLTISSENGTVAVSDVSAPTGTNLDSGGGPIQASHIDGPLTISSENGSVTVNGLTGNLDADTGGGPFSGDSLAAGHASVMTEDGFAGLTFITAPAYVLVDTGGGPAQLTFEQAPTSVMVTTDDGSATLNVPGGPYSVTASSDGGSQSVGVPTAPTARRSLTVSTGGGPLEIVPR